MIDEELRSRGSHGKDQFVYSALSLGFLRQFDLYDAGLHHGLVIWSSASPARSTLFLSTQCILMHKRKLAPHLIVGFDPEMGAKSIKVRLEEKSDFLFGESDVSGGQPTPSSPSSSTSLSSAPINTVCTLHRGSGLTVESRIDEKGPFLMLLCENVMYANLN